MECELGFTGGLPSAVASAYRGRLQVLRAAPREQAVQELVSMQLREREDGSHVMRVTDDWDLVVEFTPADEGRIALVKAIVERKTTIKESASS
jgi:plasmid maintenance system killer protein